MTMHNQNTNNKLRSLPSVEEVLVALEENELADPLPHALVVDAVRKEIAAERRSILEGSEASPSLHDIVRGAEKRLIASKRPSLRRVVNATGVIVHTNLGRSILAPEAVQAAIRAAQGYSTLEYDTAKMERGSRHAHCEELICALTGAEAAMAVNNNAGAVMMVLHEFARGREVIVSRGEQIEIGGSFRIPDIMNLSQADMVEVGTTNKTHLFDFERAVTDRTALLLKVHTSNYRIVGFTESVKAKELRKLADEVNRSRRENTEGPQDDVIVYEDLGSGLLFAPDIAGFTEPTVSEALKQGCDLVSFSGDKLLGGPQAGIIAGSKELIDRLKKNPFARALRLDKMTIAALEATLRLYLDPERAFEDVPTLRMLNEPVEATRSRAQDLASRIAKACPQAPFAIDVVDGIARAGGGSLPLFDIPSAVVEISFTRGCAQDCMTHLVKELDVPVVGRISHESLVFDARTLSASDKLDLIACGMASYASALAAPSDPGELR